MDDHIELVCRTAGFGQKGVTRSNILSNGTPLGYLCGGGPRDGDLNTLCASLMGSSFETFTSKMKAYLAEYSGYSGESGKPAGNADYEYGWFPTSPPRTSHLSNPYVDWERWTGVVLVRERSMCLRRVLGDGYFVGPTLYSEWMPLDKAVALWETRAAKRAAKDAAVVAQAIATPAAVEIETELSLASNMLGRLDASTRARIVACYARPSQKTWENAYSILLDPREMTTLWKAVLAVDQSFPQHKPCDARWPRVPTRETLRSALQFATR